jgi:hypothetical protein
VELGELRFDPVDGDGRSGVNRNRELLASRFVSCGPAAVTCTVSDCGDSAVVVPAPYFPTVTVAALGSGYCGRIGKGARLLLEVEVGREVAEDRHVLAHVGPRVRAFIGVRVEPLPIQLPSFAERFTGFGRL